MAMSQIGPSLSPRLGSHLSIVTSLFAAIVFLVLIFEQLGTGGRILQLAMIGGAALTIGATGLLTASRRDWAFRVADRRVPGAFASIGLTISLLGATGIASLSGLFFLEGFDALPYAIGIIVGLLVSAVLVQPYVRKDGAPTLAGYIGRRFESRLLRLLAGIAISIALLLILAAELKLGVAVAARRLGTEPWAIAVAFFLMLALSVASGGARSQAWTGASGGMLSLISIIVPVTLVSILLTNLPVPQLSYGVISDSLAGLESRSGLARQTAAAILPAVPPSSPSLLTKPFFQPFAAYGTTGYLLIIVTIAAGVAAHPLIAQRSATGSNVLAVRRMMAWTAFIAGLVLLTLPAIGIFARYIVLSGLVGLPIDQVPSWLDGFVAAGWVSYDGQGPRLSLDSLALARDSVLLLLPAASGLPATFADLALVGLLAAALTAASAHVLALASTIGEDILLTWREETGAETARTALLRALTVVLAGLGCWMAVSVRADPFGLLLWGLAIIGASILAPVVMSVWWKRINRWGAMLAVGAGFGISGSMMLLDLSGASGGAGSGLVFAAAVMALALTTAAAIVFSLLTPRPEKRILDLVRDMRVPGGETLLDRELRLQRASLRRPV
ncbi:MAG: hypothetical protein R3D57_03085 [Hyphomicrobiaceae bacterium]